MKRFAFHTISAVIAMAIWLGLFAYPKVFWSVFGVVFLFASLPFLGAVRFTHYVVFTNFKPRLVSYLNINSTASRMAKVGEQEVKLPMLLRKINAWFWFHSMVGLVVTGVVMGIIVSLLG